MEKIKNHYIRVKEAICLIVLLYLLPHCFSFNVNFHTNLSNPYYQRCIHIVFDTIRLLSSVFIARVPLRKILVDKDSIKNKSRVIPFILSLLIPLVYLFLCKSENGEYLIDFDKIRQLFQQISFFSIFFFSFCVFFSAFCEEFFFKGLLFNGLRNETEIPIGFNILIVCSLFSLCHTQYYGTIFMLFPFLFQLMTLLFYCYYPSIWLTTVIHFIINICVIIVGSSQ